MEKQETNYLVIALIIIIILIVFFKWDSIKSFFKGKPILPDGTPCSHNPRTGGAASYKGVIKNGLCVPKQVNVVAKKLKVIATAGTYAVDFAPASGYAKGCLTVRKALIPFGTEMTILEKIENYSNCIEPLTTTIYRTSDGWFSLNSGTIQVI